jgi:hypothetical protein
MSLYIDKNNQSYLWNTVTKHPKFQPHLREIPPERFSEWFRSIIEGFYLNWGGNKRPMNPEELKQLNRNTIAYIYENLSGHSSSVASHSFTQEPMTVPYENPMMPAVTVSRENTGYDLYRNGIGNGIDNLSKKPVQVLPEFTGQHEYQKRTESYQTPPTPSNPIQGKVDSDKRESQDKMERRIMEEQKQREMDIQLFSPPSQIGGKQAVNLNLLKMNGEAEPPQNGHENIQFVIRETSSSSLPVSLPVSSPVSSPVSVSEKGLAELAPVSVVPEKGVDAFLQEFRQLFSETKQSIEELKQQIKNTEKRLDKMEQTKLFPFMSTAISKNILKPTTANTAANNTANVTANNTANTTANVTATTKRKATLRGKETEPKNQSLLNI